MCSIGVSPGVRRDMEVCGMPGWEGVWYSREFTTGSKEGEISGLQTNCLSDLRKASWEMG